MDAPLQIEVTGARAGEPVTLSVASVDADGVRWSQSIRYRASRNGTVDPATMSGNDGGATIGPDPTAPLDLMTNPRMFASRRTLTAWPFGMYSGYVNAYSWDRCAPQALSCAWSQSRRFVFTARSESVSATATIERGPAVPVKATVERIGSTAFYGVYWQPPAAHDNHIGILEFGGSGGGIDSSFGAVLASHGYPTLDLAYVDEPGLHQHIQGLDISYFARALTWLEARPGVDAQHVWVMGWSLGSQAALLLGEYYPGLVHGVVALEPSDVPECSWVSPEIGPPIWTDNLAPVSCVNQINPSPVQSPAAVIPVTDIAGPILLDCGGADGVWDACEYADTMFSQLSAAGDRYPHELLYYPAAGHALGAPVPYDPGAATLEEQFQLGGRTATSNSLATAAQWPRLLAFLAAWPSS